MKYCDIWNRFPLSCHYARAAVSLIFPVVEAEGSAFTFPEFSKAFHSSVARAVFGVSSQTLDAIYMRQIVLATTRNPSLESMQKLTAMAPGKSAAAGKRFSSSAYSILADVSHAEWELAAQASTRESAARLLLNILGNYRKIRASSPEPETPCYFLRHVHTAMYVHPEGGAAVCGVRLVLQPGDHNHERRLMFSLRPDGNLQHVDSGLFVHPKGGQAKSGIELILHPDGPEPRLAFNHDGCFRHRESGLYVHPNNGKGTKGSALMLHPDDASRAYPGELQYALEPVHIEVPPTVVRSVDLIEEARNLYALISRHKAYSMHLTQRSGRTCLVRLEHRLSRRLVASNRCIHRGVSSPPTRQQNSRGGLGLLGSGRDSVTRFSVQDGHVWIRVC